MLIGVYESPLARKTLAQALIIETELTPGGIFHPEYSTVSTLFTRGNLDPTPCDTLQKHVRDKAYLPKIVQELAEGLRL